MGSSLEQGRLHAADAAGQAKESDSLWSRLGRELDLFGGGIASGLDRAVQDRLDHPWTTLAEVAGAAVAGYTLARFSGSRTLLFSLGAKTTGAALTFSFLRDVSTQAGTVWQAAADTWNSPNHLEQNKARIAGTVAPFVVDTALTMTPGLFGAKFGAIANYSDAIKTNLRGPAQESVFRIRGPEFLQDGRVVHMNGSGFAVAADGRFATAFHVADSSMRLSLDNAAGTRLTARPVAGLPSADVALLEAEPGSPGMFTPLPRAYSTDPLRMGRGYAGAAVGIPGGQHLAIRTGFFENVEGVGGKRLTYLTSTGAETAALPPRVLSGGVGDGGMSGGPVLHEDGRVIGTVMASHGSLIDRWLGDNTFHSPVENLNRLVEMTDRARVPGAAVSVGEAATRLRLTPADVLDRIDSGKLDAFMVPVGQAAAGRGLIWDWRVLVDRQR